MGIKVRRIKTSVSIDEGLWREFKRLASSRDRELSEVLEELLREELMVDFETSLRELAGELETELDFKPVKPKTPVSELVREMRDGRDDSLLRQ